MEVGVLAADPRGIAAPDVVRVSPIPRARMETFISQIIRAAKIPDMVMRRSVMYPQMVMPPRRGVPGQHRRGHNGGENGYRGECFHNGHWLSPFGETAPTSTTWTFNWFSSTKLFIDTKAFFIFAAPAGLPQFTDDFMLARAPRESEEFNLMVGRFDPGAKTSRVDSTASAQNYPASLHAKRAAHHAPSGKSEFPRRFGASPVCAEPAQGRHFLNP